MLSACAVRTSGANTTTFSTVLVCAAFIRCAQADCGLSLGDGLAVAPIGPRTMMRSRIYGTQSSPVIAAVKTSQYRSFDMSFSPRLLNQNVAQRLPAGILGKLM